MLHVNGSAQTVEAASRNAEAEAIITDDVAGVLIVLLPVRTHPSLRTGPLARAAQSAAGPGMDTCGGQPDYSPSRVAICRKLSQPGGSGQAAFQTAFGTADCPSGVRV